MSERPIIFSAPMVRAILDGRKTQTRRLPTPMWDGVMRQMMLVEPVRLWVRETWMPAIDAGDHEACCRADYTGAAVLYMAALQHWRSPIHMPRWASRITLDVVGMRRERLQEISRPDAIAEGVPSWVDGRVLLDPPPGLATESFCAFWDGLHRKPGTRWADNPDVYVIEFRRL